MKFKVGDVTKFENEVYTITKVTEDSYWALVNPQEEMEYEYEHFEEGMRLLTPLEKEML